MKAKKTKNENLSVSIIGIFFLVSSLFFGGYVFFEEHLNLNREGQTEISSNHKRTEIDSVNDHLKSVSDRMELERMRTLVANLKVSHAPKSETGKITLPEENQPIVDFSEDPRTRQVAQEMGRTNDLKKETKDPRTLMYNSVIEDRLAQKQKADDRRQQANEFVQNARKDGWIVKLDENYKIKSYRRVDQDESDAKDPDIQFNGFPVIPK